MIMSVQVMHVQQIVVVSGNDIVEGTEECDGADDSVCPGLCTLSCACEAESSSGGGKWIIFLIVFLLLGSAIFFYIRGKSKNAGKSVGKPSQEYRPFTSQLEKAQPQQQKMNWPSTASSAKSKIEDDIDKSLEEAKKLLKKL